LAGLFCFHSGDYQGAERYLADGLKKYPNSILVLNGMGLIHLEDGTDAMDFFDKSLSSSIRDVEAMLGKAISARLQGQHDLAFELLSRIIAYHPTFVPAFREQIIGHFQAKTINWDHIRDAANRLGGIQAENIDSATVLAVYDICVEGVSEKSSSMIESLRKVIMFDTDNRQERI
jgi:tetratricopeptide (TPR) repeat protein